MMCALTGALQDFGGVGVLAIGSKHIASMIGI